MEVLKSDDKLRQEILEDARKKADKIIKKAKEDAVEIEKKTAVNIEKTQEEYSRSINKEIDFEVNKIYSSIDILVKKKKINHTGGLINGIFDNLKRSIIENKFIGYEDFLMKLIEEYGNEINSAGYIIEIGESYSKYLQDDKIKKIKLGQGSIMEIINIKNLDGMRLYSQDRKKVVFISIDSFFERLKTDERNKVYEIISGGQDG